MAEHLVTGYAGVGHVTAADAGLFNAGICGAGKYVLESTGKFPFTLESNNLITIGSGDLVDQGRHITIATNTSVSLAIDNGSQGKSRIDVVAMRYSKDTSTGVESAALVIIKGTEVNSGATPTVPSVTSGNIYTGAITDDTPLYHIRIDELQVTSVTSVFTLMPPISGILDKVYPVGSIYMSVNSTNPGLLFGGTWTTIGGRFLIGQSSKYPAGELSGSATKTITTANMPSHIHRGPSHYHTVPAHNHSIPSHRHEAICGLGGEHVHQTYRAKIAGAGTARFTVVSKNTESAEIGNNTKESGEHRHIVTIGSGGAGTTGNAGATNTTNAGSGYTDSTGGGTAMDIMPPYLAVYMWKRTA